MKEIKFRAWAEDWDTHKMTMFYGVQCSYDTISNKGKVIPHDQWTSFSELLSDDNITVMQYTGLLDKNLKEIYEGDIVSTSDNGEPSTDRWKNEDWGYRQVTFDEYGVCFGDWNWKAKDLVMSLKYIEVVGNIYENPKLLKEVT